MFLTFSFYRYKFLALQPLFYKYFGTHMDNLLKWDVHIDVLCAKLVQRLHFLCRLRLLGVSIRVMTAFIIIMVLQSLIRYGMTALFGSLTINGKSKLEKQVKKAMEIIRIKD